MGAQHTPGPWEAKWSKYREGEFIVQAAFPSNRVLAVFDGDGTGPDPEEIASAHLIAGAPELLEALRIFLNAAVPASTDIKAKGYDWCEAYLDEARTIAVEAIAKARGETA